MPKQDDIPMKSEESNAMAPDMTKAPETSTAEVSETKPPQAKFSRSGLLALIAVAVCMPRSFDVPRVSAKLILAQL